MFVCILLGDAGSGSEAAAVGDQLPDHLKEHERGSLLVNPEVCAMALPGIPITLEI